MALIYDIRPPKNIINLPATDTTTAGNYYYPFTPEAQGIVDLRDKSILDRTVYAWSWWDFNEERFKHSSFTFNKPKTQATQWPRINDNII